VEQRLEPVQVYWQRKICHEYYEVPAHVPDDSDELAARAEEAVDVPLIKSIKKKKRS
jgi:hypothetical protein